MFSKFSKSAQWNRFYESFKLFNNLLQKKLTDMTHLVDLSSYSKGINRGVKGYISGRIFVSWLVPTRL